MTGRPPSPLKGARIGDYQVCDLLGQGGFGEVWAAQHVARPEQVAIKILHASTVEDSTAVQRFLREASASEAIGHPSVIQVFDTGVHEGRPYLVMELLTGQTLRTALRDPTTTVDQKLALLEQLLEPLDAAHQRGFVHRDLKPSNVMVTASGVKLLDFGLARSANESGLTMSGTTLGTPYYTSPEAARSAKDATPASDVWAIGCMLHEVFTGERTFHGKTAADVLIKLCTKQPPPLPENVPKPWARLVLWCLEKQPAKRPRDAGHLRVVWRRVTNGHMPDEKKDLPFASTALDIDSGATDLVSGEAVSAQVSAEGALSTAELGQMGGQSGGQSASASASVVAPVGVHTMSSETPPPQGKSKVAVVLVLALAGIASAALVFFVLSGMNPQTPPVASASAPAVSDIVEMPEGDPVPQEGQVRILSTLEGADFFVDAQAKGALESDMTFVLTPGTHQLEARRGDRVLASTPVEIDVGEITEVTLGESQPVQIRRHHARVRVARNDTRRAESPTEANPTLPTPTTPTANPTANPTSPTSNVDPGPTVVAEPTTMTTNAPQPGVYPTSPATPVMAPSQMIRTGPTAFNAPPTERQLQTRLRDLRSRVQTCTGDFHGELDASVQWDGGTGRVTSRIGRGPPRAARQCVQRVINQHAGLQFPGGRQRIRFTFRL